MIEATDLYFHYPGAARPALDRVSLRVVEGERVALLGPNGAGKSTLLLTMAGVYRPKGRLLIGGVEGGAPFNQRLGLVFQDADDQLFLSTVFDDVAFGPLNMGLPPEEVKARVARALREVGCEGYEPRSSQKLSGGEKRRISLATVLSMDASVLLLDEPTANLDPRGRRAILSLLLHLKKTLLIATHDLELAAQLCTRGVLMESGRIYADLPIDELLQQRSLLEEHGL